MQTGSLHPSMATWHLFTGAASLASSPQRCLPRWLPHTSSRADLSHSLHVHGLVILCIQFSNQQRIQCSSTRTLQTSPGASNSTIPRRHQMGNFLGSNRWYRQTLHGRAVYGIGSAFTSNSGSDSSRAAPKWLHSPLFSNQRAGGNSPYATPIVSMRSNFTVTGVLLSAGLSLFHARLVQRPLYAASPPLPRCGSSCNVSFNQVLLTQRRLQQWSPSFSDRRITSHPWWLFFEQSSDTPCYWHKI